MGSKEGPNKPTFDFLLLLVANVPGDFQSVAYQRIAAGVMHRSFHGWIELNDIDSQSRAFGKASELVVYGLELDCVDRNECGMSRTLVA